MCVIIAKYFDDKGWVGVKNRDRNYIPKIKFDVLNGENTERLMLHDTTTGYKEGINSHGVCILSASLMVIDDEKEVVKSSNEHSPDGKRISDALQLRNAVSAAKYCIQNSLTGNNIIFDRENMFLLEACLDKRGKYRHVIRKIPRNAVVARTNHGIWLPWAGYQRSDDENQSLSRISSEARLEQAQHVVDNATDPEELIDGLCKIYINHPQLNVLRTSTERKKMRTTAQEMLIPGERTFYCRPVSSHIEFDFWKMNKPHRNTWVELLSNRALWQDTKGDPPFTSNGMKHT